MDQAEFLRELARERRLGAEVERTAYSPEAW